MKGNVWSELAVRFALLSLAAFGGANVVIPDMHRQFVEELRWLPESEFANLFALSQAAPGPNVLIVSLIGWKVAGLGGALLATAAMCGPSCLLTFAATRFWWRQRGALPWRATVQRGLAPVAVGLVLASGFVLARAADRGSWTAGLVTGAAALLVLRTRVHPLWLFAAAAALGAIGWI